MHFHWISWKSKGFIFRSSVRKDLMGFGYMLRVSVCPCVSVSLFETVVRTSVPNPNLSTSPGFKVRVKHRCSSSLVTFSSYLYSELVLNIVGETRAGLWVGLHDKTTEGNWEWEDGTPVRQYNFLICMTLSFYNWFHRELGQMY